MKKIDFRVLGGLALIAIVVFTVSLVGNNQRSEAGIEDSAISLNLSFSQIRTIIGDLKGFLGMEEPIEEIELGSGSRYPNGISTDSTSPSAGEVRTTTLTVTGASTLTSTSTLQGEPLSVVIGGNFTMSTGTAKSVYTHSGVDYVCDGNDLVFSVTSTDWAPSLSFALGTSTSATGYATGLVASTTVATTTGAVTENRLLSPANADAFLLTNGLSIVGAIQDVNVVASTTYLSNYNVDWSTTCWAIDQ